MVGPARLSSYWRPWALYRPFGTRRTPRGRVRPRTAVPPRVRSVGRAHRDRLGRRTHSASVGRTNAASRVCPLRGPRRRPRCWGHRRHGPAGARGAGRHPSELPQDGDRRRPPARPVRRGTCRGGGGHRVQEHRLRLFPGADHAAPDHRLCPPRLTCGFGCLDAGPRHGQLLQDFPSLCRWATVRQPHPGPHPRQHHPVLADV